MSKLRTANLMGALATAIADRVEADLKTHPNQNDSAAAALNLIALYEGCSNLALSRGLKLSHPATLRLVGKLEASGLVEVRPGPDKRTSALFLTPGGKMRARASLQSRCAVLGGIVELLSPEQRQQLDGIAETLLRALTTTPQEGGHICRLCDEADCPADHCPVHQRALELMSA